MENKIPTAEELLRTTEFSFKEPGHFEETIEFMKQFAKLHCEAQLKAIVINAEQKQVPYTEDYEIDYNSIINAYSLTNIN